MLKHILLSAALVGFGASAAWSGDFSMSFDWGNLKSCTSGNPNTVPNPVFKLKNVPEGTHWIYFAMKDRSVPSYNHGGGWVQYTGKDTISPGAFKYKSPCPPSGSHTYEWTATAKGKKSSFGGAVAVAKASKKYP